MERNLEFWRDRSVFVTGGSGLVGGWLVKRLVGLGAQVTCLIRDWAPDSLFVEERLDQRVTVIRGELTDQLLLERAIGESEASCVLHLAAQTIVGIANRNPVSTFDSNIRGTWSLLEACRRSPLVKSIVVASSDKAYGEVEKLPYTETTPLAGRHPYDVSKSCADLLAQSYAASFDLPVAITRCGNFFGGGDLNWNRLIPGTIRSLIRDEAPVIRSDGQYVRDYLYVEDGVEAYLLLAEKLAADSSLAGRAFNYSLEQPSTVLEIVMHLCTLMEAPQSPKVMGEASNEIRAQYLDSSRARAELGWAPQFSLEDGLRRTIAWYCKRLGGKL